jgi:hypothetical protein
MVGVAQLAEHRVVVPGVVGSSPITHPERQGARTGALRTHWRGAQPCTHWLHGIAQS